LTTTRTHHAQHFGRGHNVDAAMDCHSAESFEQSVYVDICSAGLFGSCREQIATQDRHPVIGFV